MPIPKAVPIPELTMAFDPMALRVLLVGDDPFNQKVTLLMLQRLGYRADVAENGIQALDAIHRAHYDLVLMDIQMTWMDGLNATRSIRAELPAEHQPMIIAMTADDTAEGRTRYLHSGMDYCLPKPVQMEQLAAELGKFSPRRGNAARRQFPDPVARTSTEPQPELRVLPPAGSLGPVDTPVYDPRALDALVANLGEDGVDVRKDLIEAYLADSADRLVALTEAPNDANGDVLLAYTAHAMKSASATLGLVALSTVAADIEMAFRIAPEDLDIALEATQLINELQRATNALRATLKPLPSPARPPAVHSPDAVSETLVELSWYLLGGQTLREVIAHVVELTKKVIPTDIAGITLFVARLPEITVFSDIGSGSVEGIQHLASGGPCVEAYQSGQIVRIPSVTEETRWADFTVACASQGIGSVLSLPLSAGDETFGALNLYARSEAAFTAEYERLAEAFTTHAAVLLLNARHFDDARRLNENLEKALQSRQTIDYAKGILISQTGRSPDEAFQLLVRASQRENRKLREIASEIVQRARTRPRPPSPTADRISGP